MPGSKPKISLPTTCRFQDHFPLHLDLLPDIGDDLDYGSSNKGLEIIWMLITKERKMIFPYFFTFKNLLSHEKKLITVLQMSFDKINNKWVWA